MLRLVDVLLTLVHLVIIGFNLFGWISPARKRFHFFFVLLTAASWFILGIWFGWGYCPVTDWQWRVKEQLGEHNLPNSFIKYYADKLTGNNYSPSLIDTVTVVCFALAALLSIYFNFVDKKVRRNKAA